MPGFAPSSAAAYLGGHLVFGEQIGVNHAAAQEMPKDFVPVMAEAELAEGEMKRVHAGGVAVLLVRCEGEVCALAHTCSHLGGPRQRARWTATSFSVRGTARDSTFDTEVLWTDQRRSRSLRSRRAFPKVRSRSARWTVNAALAAVDLPVLQSYIYPLLEGWVGVVPRAFEFRDLFTLPV
jgi:nitrite reductase/ring-hydroxylating ferredoxin subunit